MVRQLVTLAAFGLLVGGSAGEVRAADDAVVTRVLCTAQEAVRYCLLTAIDDCSRVCVRYWLQNRHTGDTVSTWIRCEWNPHSCGGPLGL